MKPVQIIEVFHLTFRRPASALARLALVGLIVASCSSGSLPSSGASASPAGASPTLAVTPASVPTPTIEPTSTPEPTPAPSVSADQLATACDGTPVPEAAEYAGTLHPLVVVRQSPVGWTVDMDAGYGYRYPINAKWYDGLWPGPIQLVVCDDGWKDVKIGSCGTYTRSSDGQAGEVIRSRADTTVRVIVARTGKVLQSKVFPGSAPAACAKSYDFSSNQLGCPQCDPPWSLFSNNVEPKVIDSYATTVSTQTVK